MLGLYYLSIVRDHEPGEGMLLGSVVRGAPCARGRRRHPARQGARAASHTIDDERQPGRRGSRDHAGPHDPRRAAAEEAGREAGARQPASDQEGHLRHDRCRLPQLRSEGDGDLLRPDHGAGLPARVQGRHLVRQGRHADPRHQGEDRRRDDRARARVRAAVQRRPHHAAREVQQGRRRLVEVHRPDRQGDDGAHLLGAEGQGRPREADELGLDDVATPARVARRRR